MISVWDQVKTTPIETVAERFGIRLGTKSTTRCPFPDHIDKTPSFSLNRRLNVFKCHACGKHGTVIDFVAYLKGCQPREAVKWLNTEFRYNTNPHAFAAETKHTEETTKSQVSHFTPDPAIYKTLLNLCPPHTVAREYLSGRGISERTQAAFRIGFLDNSEATLAQLLKLYERDALLRAGLLYRRDSQRLSLPDASIVFPFLSSDDIIYVQSRSISSNSKRRWMGLFGVKKPVYNLDVSIGATTVYLCEGVTDVLSAHELGLPALGLTGAHANIPDSLVRSLKGKTVIILPDADEAGAHMASRINSTLRKARIHSVVQKLPFGTDLNDYLLISRKSK